MCGGPENEETLYLGSDASSEECKRCLHVSVCGALLSGGGCRNLILTSGMFEGLCFFVVVFRVTLGSIFKKKTSLVLFQLYFMTVELQESRPLIW